MGTWSRAELEDAFAAYQAAGAEAGRTGDWSRWADLFTEDARYLEHHYGTFEGREAIRSWITTTMGEWPGCDMPEFPVGWYVVDEDRGWIVCQVFNRMKDPGDGSIHEADNVTILHYAGDGRWSYEEDVYNPADFATMVNGWVQRRRELGAFVSRALEAVCFDYWNTIVQDNGSTVALRREAWAARLGAIGVAVADHELDAAFEGAWRRFNESWEANRQYVVGDAATDLLELLGVDDPDGAIHAALLQEMHAIAETAELSLTPGVEGALRTLKEAGLGLAVVCDVGMMPSTVLRRILERHGVLELFDHFSFSDEVGWYKPAPEIFRHALDGLGGIEPAAAAHVGDLRRTDVAGARAMGMLAVRYRGVADDQSDVPDADLVVDHHDALPAALLSE